MKIVNKNYRWPYTNRVQTPEYNSSRTKNSECFNTKNSEFDL